MATKDLILERFGSLSVKLQEAARFVVDHPNDVVISSMRTLAQRAGAQPATFVRLAQQLGFAGWPELKAAVAADLGLRGKRYGERAKALTSRGRDADLAAELFAAQRHNLEVTAKECGPNLRVAAKVLRKARTVHVAGFRASYPIAYSLYYGYRLFRSTVQLVHDQAGGLDMALRAIDKQDALVTISFAPYSREALRVATAGKAAGAAVVGLTDSAASPLALVADVSVLFSIESPSFFPSVAAGIAVTESLLEILVAEGRSDIPATIDRAEKELFESGAYVLPPAKRPPRG